MQRTRSQALVQTNQKGAVKLPERGPRRAHLLESAKRRSVPPPHAASEHRAALGRHPFTPTVAPQVAGLPGSLSPGGGSPCPPGAGPPGQHPPQNCQSALASRAVTSHKSLSGT